MSNIFIDKQKFKEIVMQFKGDVGYQTELLNTLVDQLPAAYAKEVLTGLYFNKVYVGPYYRVQHSIISSKERIFIVFADLLSWLRDNRLEGDSYVTAADVRHAIEKGTPIYGYKIFFEEKGGYDNA